MPFPASRAIGTKNFQDLPMVFMDAETTGESLSRGGEICEIGLVKVDPRTLVSIAELDLKFAIKNPHGRTEAELSYNGYNGFTFQGWQGAQDPRVALDRLLNFCDGCVPWAYNVSFEYTWLDSYLEQYQLGWSGDYHWHCLMSVASYILRPDFQAGRVAKLSLSSIGSYLGLGEEASPHRGLAGARYEHAVYRRLLELRA